MKFLISLLCLVFAAGIGYAGETAPVRPEKPFPIVQDSYIENTSLSLVFPPREHVNMFQEIGGRDPLEGFNRVMFWTNDFFLRWIFRPIGIGYATIMPRPAIKAINNVTNNVAFPKRFLSCLLQGKFKDSGLCFTRFVTNSTVGVGGIWDASDYFLDIQERDEDFGQAFASWGIAPGCYVFLPGEGPCNIRDGIGKIFDYAVDIKSYIYGGQAATGFHRLLARYEDYDMAVQAYADPYQMIKNFWYIQEINQAEDTPLNINLAEANKNVKTPPFPIKNKIDYIKMAGYGSQGVEIDTLKAMFFDVQKEKQSFWTYLSLFNTDFVNNGSVYSVKLQKDKDEMSYCLWRQDENPKAPLILIIPGLGAHYRDSKVMALAEVLNTKGFSVAAISSAFNWQFMETAASVDAPGFLPADAADVRSTWAKILAQIKAETKLRPERIVMVGYSMGAMHSLYIAKLEEQENILGIDRYFAINPPSDLLYGVAQLDRYFEIHEGWSKKEFVQRGKIAFGKAMAITKNQYRWYDSINTPKLSRYEITHHKLAIDKDNAKLLIGYAFRMTLQEILLSMHRRGKLTGLKTQYDWSNQEDVYDEILRMSFRGYMEQVLFPLFRDRFGKNVTLDEFEKKMGSISTIESFTNHLVDNPDIRIIHTMNDFLLRDEDRIRMKEIFGDKIVFFEHGGHLGNLHFLTVQKKMHALIKRPPLVPPERQRYYREHYASLAAPYSVPSIPPPNSEFHNPR